MANWPRACARFFNFFFACVIAGVIVLIFFPIGFAIDVSHWSRHDPPADFSYNNTDWLSQVMPARCHAHNDYSHKYPLYSALQAGCVGVEADIWLYQEELYVGHSTSALRPGQTLEKLYIEPLVEILEMQNKQHVSDDIDETPVGVFTHRPSQTLTLLIDIKMQDGKSGWPLLTSQLDPLRRRNFLTHYNGTSIVSRPITIAATGNAPFDMVTSNSTYRDVFFDAPLDKIRVEHAVPAQPGQNGALLHVQSRNQTNDEKSNVSLSKTSPYNCTNSYYASVSFRKSIGLPYFLTLSNGQMETIRQQVRSAHDMNLKVRYWSVPGWPPFMKRRLMELLLREGVDLLNIDDLSLVNEKLYPEE